MCNSYSPFESHKYINQLVLSHLSEKHHIMANCGCGTCDLKGLLTKGCPNPVNQQFLYLDTRTLTKNEKDILLLKVKADADAINTEHRHMILKFKTWMKENVSIENYSDILLNIPGTIRKEVSMLQDRWEEINVADHSKCSQILSNYYMWFNCSVQIWFQNTQCAGTESSIYQCPHGAWGGYHFMHTWAGCLCCLHM